jgi:hypothetical protein
MTVSQHDSGAQLVRWRSDDGLRVDMVVAVHPTFFSCGDAKVDLVISGTSSFWRDHPRLAGAGQLPTLTRVAFGWDPASSLGLPSGVPRRTAAPALVGFVGADAQAPLHPGLATDELVDQDPAWSAHGFPHPAPVGLVLSLRDWGASHWPIHLHFTANWVKQRGFGTCYVVLPSLLANGSFAGTQDAIEALVGRRDDLTQATSKMNAMLPEAASPSYGRFALSIADGSLSESDSTPAPDDDEAAYIGRNGESGPAETHQFAGLQRGRLSPVWDCEPRDNLRYLRTGLTPNASAYSGDACGAVAVVDVNGANSVKAVVIVLIGAMLALSLERLLRKPKPRDDDQS